MSESSIKINVIIAAGGSSERYGTNKLLEHCGTSIVLGEAIKPFLEIEGVSKVIVASNHYSREFYIRAMKAQKLTDARITYVDGGASRTLSVAEALKYTEDDCSVILVHDGARPYLKTDTIRKVIDGVLECGAAVPLIPLADNLARIQDGRVIPADRTDLRRVQTPAGFDAKRIKSAYEKCDGDYLDDITVVQKFCPGKLKAVEGDIENVKITWTPDLSAQRIGSGYDIHRLKSGKGVKLCGVSIPCPYTFEAHSDGDVPVHALMDAILTALAEPDIGHYFPVDNPKYKNADSMDLLSIVTDVMAKKNYAVSNVSVAVIAEKPMLSPYINDMRKRLSEALNLSPDRIGISATTNEGTGLIGGGEAIAAFSSVLLYPINK